MQTNNICLVCYLDQDNLGVGYLASSLLETGCFDITLVNMREKTPEIIKGIVEYVIIALYNSKIMIIIKGNFCYCYYRYL